MRTRLGVAGLAAFFALLLAGMIVQSDQKLLTPTSYGAIPGGYGALYDLLEESGLPVARSFAPPERLAERRTIWWIEPAGLPLEEREEDPPREKAEEKKTEQPPALRGVAFARWIEAGGTAVVLFPGRPGPRAPLAVREVPARGFERPLPEEEDEPSAPYSLPLDSVAGAARTLELPTPLVFRDVDADAWRTIARLAGEPFVIEAALGAGRLVLVADARFASNAWLDRADAAPFAADLVRAYGVPWLDEHEHGFSASRGTLAYLAGSPALPFFAGLGLLALAFGWFGAAQPAREVAEFDPSAPTLETYVASLAHLYATTRDHARVFDRYRELTVRRLRRHFGLPPDASLASVSERLARRAGASPVALALLGGSHRVQNQPELWRAVATLDALVSEVSQ